VGKNPSPGDCVKKTIRATYGGIYKTHMKRTEFKEKSGVEQMVDCDSRI